MNTNPQRRGRRYTQTDVNRLLEEHRTVIRELRAEVTSLSAQNVALLRQLADADDMLLRIETDTTRLGRVVRDLAEETEWNAESEPRRLHPSASPAGESGVAPARLRLVTAPNDNNRG
jgi:hypothetical protein